MNALAQALEQLNEIKARAKDGKGTLLSYERFAKLLASQEDVPLLCEALKESQANAAVVEEKRVASLEAREARVNETELDLGAVARVILRGEERVEAAETRARDLEAVMDAWCERFEKSQARVAELERERDDIVVALRVKVATLERERDALKNHVDIIGAERFELQRKLEKEAPQLKEPTPMTPIEHLHYLKTVTLGSVGAPGAKDAVSAFIELVKAEEHCRAVYHPIEKAQYVHAQRAVRDAFNRVMGKEEGEE